LGKVFLRGEFDLCTGCNTCLLICSYRARGGFNPRWGRLKINMEQEGLIHRPVVCTHCENAFCVRACPTGALYQSENEWILINKEKCIGCGQCVQVCPDDMIAIDPEQKADKCDFCDGDPQCVQFCPTGALRQVVEKEVR